MVLMPWNDDWHSLRLQPGRLLPGRPEHFWRDSSRQRCGGIATRLNHGGAVPWRNGDEGGVTDLFRHTAFGSGPTPSEAIKAADFPHCTEAPCEFRTVELH